VVVCLLVFPSAFEEVSVELRNHLGADFFGACSLALGEVAAISKTFDIHLVHHSFDAAIALCLALGEVSEVGDFGGHEEHGGAVFAGGDTSAAADASRCIHGLVRFGFGNGQCIGIGCPASVDGDITSCLYNAVQGRTVNDQVTDDRKGLGAPGLHINFIAVVEVAHVQLAGGDAFVSAMWLAINHHRAHATNAFAAVVIKGNGLLAVVGQVFIEDVHHFQKGHMRADIAECIFLHFTGLLRSSLTPNVQLEFHRFVMVRAHYL